MLGVHLDLRGLSATQDLGDSWTQAAADGHVWDHGPDAARVCVDVCYVLPQGPMLTMF